MIYISAQPDQVYFIWQLEIQLRNLANLGVLKENIHVLAGYDPKRGMNPDFKFFIENSQSFALFFAYPDTRINPRYISSIRPNVLKQHFDRFPKLNAERFFYLDSDVLFSRIPNILDLDKSEICYVSDTRDYLGVDYIRNSASEELFDKMVDIVGISKEKIFNEDNNTGGAQYILKGVDKFFWEKVETDSERLFELMSDYNRKLWERIYPITMEYRSKRRGIQAWCADMWAVLWNLWLRGKNVEIHEEMDFSWPYSPIEEWEKFSIQHYSGILEENSPYFKKSKYQNYLPWFDDSLNSISSTSCSYKIVESIIKRRKELEESRPQFKNLCIILYGDLLNEENRRLTDIVKRFYTKFFNISITTVFNEKIEVGVNVENWPDSFRTEMKDLHFVNKLLWIPFNCIIGRINLNKLLNLITDVDFNTNISINSGDTFEVDSLFTETFEKILNEDLLAMNQGKFNLLTPRSKGLILIQYINDKMEPIKSISSNGTEIIFDKTFLIT